MRHLAHFLRIKGRWETSGYCACGDMHEGRGDRSRKDFIGPPRPFTIVDLGCGFSVDAWGGSIYPHEPGPAAHWKFRPDGIINAARLGWFGFRLLSREEAAALQGARQEAEEAIHWGPRPTATNHCADAPSSAKTTALQTPAEEPLP